MNKRVLLVGCEEPFLTRLLTFQGLNFAAGAAVVDAGAGAGGDSGAPAGGAGVDSNAGNGGDSGAGAGAPASGQNEGGAPAQSGSAGVENLRQQYESTKAQLDRWTKLGQDPDKVAPHLTAGTALYNKYAGIAEKLGYKGEEFDEAFGSDPDKTILFLQRKHAEAAANQGPLTEERLKELLDEQLAEKLKPINEKENLRLASEADFKVKTTFDQLGQQAYTPEGWKSMDKGEREALQEVMNQMLAFDEQALIAIKTKGATAPVQKYFREAQKWLDGYFQSRMLRETNGGGGTRRAEGGKPPAAPKGPAEPTGRGINPDTKKPWTISEFIEEPSRIDPKYA